MKNRFEQIDVVLVHGWGLNSEIWRRFVERAHARNSLLRFHLIDLPGYGRDHALTAQSDIESMASHCLARAPESAVWVGWSLGGLAALKAFELAGSERVKGLQLIGTMSKFTASEDCPEGVDGQIFQRFADELKRNYQRAMARFLQLQLFRVDGGRQLIEDAMQLMSKYPDPSPSTLQKGIDCLHRVDLRESARQIGMNAMVPIQVVMGTLDRVANPLGVASLANYLAAEIIEIHTGHAVFLAEPDPILDHLEYLVGQAYV